MIFYLDTDKSLERDAAYLNNNQREAIDAEAKSTLRDLNAAITNLSQAETIRQQSDAALAQKRRRKNGFTALGQWAAGGKERVRSDAEDAEDARQSGIKSCREGVIWYLQRHLGTCSQVQGQMMETRISAEIEKSRNALSLAKGTMPTQSGGAASSHVKDLEHQDTSMPVEELDRSYSLEEQDLSVEQMQLFQQENKDMLKLYSDRLDQVR